MADRFLIVSDVDGTMLGDDSALESLAAWLAPRRDSIQLVYNSGRSTDSLRRSVAKTLLPKPDALIGNVGTQVESFDTSTPLGDWPVLSGAWDQNVVRQVFQEIEGVALQPAGFQSQHKVSYFAYDASEAQIGAWQAQLEAAGLNVKIVYSSQRDLDILPTGIDKGTATAHLADAWKVPLDRVIVCGDTGNDIAMFEQGFLGIVVGNALPELKSLNSPRIFQASDHFAAGVGEGLRHWFENSESAPLRRA